jgi:aminomethyltransferase
MRLDRSLGGLSGCPRLPGNCLPEEKAVANRTPLYDWHVRQGARMVDFAGWDMPIQYTTIIEEHQAVRNAAGLFDISHMGRLRFDGSQAADWLQHVFTNDVPSMKSGQARYGLVCNEQGGILDDVLVYRFDASWLMVVNASNREKIVDWVTNHQDGRNATLTDQTREMAMVAVQGPRAVEIVSAYAAGSERIKYYFAEVKTSGGDSAQIVSRTGYTGEDGFELMVPGSVVLDVVNRLADIARGLGFELKPSGLGARDTLRLEAAMPLYGHELNESVDPLQAGLQWAVKFEKGDFLGRDALARRRQDPKLRRRIGLELSGKRLAREGARVLKDAQEIGAVTSGTFAPTLQKAIAMAYVDPTQSSPGVACEVDVRGKPEPARVVPLPFYKRPKT